MLQSSVNLPAANRLQSLHGSCWKSQPARAVRGHVSVPRCRKHICAAHNPDVPVHFKVPCEVAYGEELALVGNTAALGSWEPTSAPAMTWTQGHIWTLLVSLPVGQEVEYKIVKRSHANVTWEACPNRTLMVAAAEGASGALTEIKVKNQWKHPESTEVTHVYAAPEETAGGSANSAPAASEPVAAPQEVLEPVVATQEVSEPVASMQEVPEPAAAPQDVPAPVTPSAAASVAAEAVARVEAVEQAKVTDAAATDTEQPLIESQVAPMADPMPDATVEEQAPPGLNVEAAAQPGALAEVEAQPDASTVSTAVPAEVDEATAELDATIGAEAQPGVGVGVGVEAAAAAAAAGDVDIHQPITTIHFAMDIGSPSDTILQDPSVDEEDQDSIEGFLDRPVDILGVSFEEIRVMMAQATGIQLLPYDDPPPPPPSPPTATLTVSEPTYTNGTANGNGNGHGPVAQSQSQTQLVNGNGNRNGNGNGNGYEHANGNGNGNGSSHGTDAAIGTPKSLTSAALSSYRHTTRRPLTLPRPPRRPLTSPLAPRQSPHSPSHFRRGPQAPAAHPPTVTYTLLPQGPATLEVSTVIKGRTVRLTQPVKLSANTLNLSAPTPSPTLKPASRSSFPPPTSRPRRRASPLASTSALASYPLVLEDPPPPPEANPQLSRRPRLPRPSLISTSSFQAASAQASCPPDAASPQLPGTGASRAESAVAAARPQASRISSWLQGLAAPWAAPAMVTLATIGLMAGFGPLHDHGLGLGATLAAGVLLGMQVPDSSKPAGSKMEGEKAGGVAAPGIPMQDS